jgi:8-oxo-dGTP pyrophosphatase MutT (NUDIX family)
MQALLGTTVHVVIDRPIGYLHGDILYPVNYGYIPGMEGGDGEEQDAYILGIDTPLTEFDGMVIGVVMRKNDCEDKLVVAPKGMELHQGQIAEAVRFQEQYFDTYIIPLFHKSCGILPYRIHQGQREYLIVFEEFSQCWSLPKGHMEAGETEVQAALRELYEETGLTGQPDVTKRAVLEYPLRPIGRKQVILFPALVTGTPKVRPGEIQNYRWIRAEQFGDYLFPDTAAICQTLM